GTIALYAAVGPLAVYLRIGRYDRRDRTRAGETGTPPWASGAGSPVGSGSSMRSRLGSAAVAPAVARPPASSPSSLSAQGTPPPELAPRTEVSRSGGPWSQAEEDFFVAGERLGTADDGTANDGAPGDPVSGLAAPPPDADRLAVDRLAADRLAAARLPDA